MGKSMRVGFILGLAIAGVALAGVPAMAARPVDARTGFIQSCVAQMDMSQGACGCVADKAEQMLDTPSVAYLEIQANNGPVAAAAAKRLTGSEIAKIDKFMRSVPDQCQAGK
jgi:hypothetical protein